MFPQTQNNTPVGGRLVTAIKSGVIIEDELALFACMNNDAITTDDGCACR